MLLNILHSLNSLIELPSTPVRLNASGSSIFNYDVNGKLLSRLSPLVCLEGILDLGDGCNSFKQALEEENHLLVFIRVYASVVIEDVEANCHDDVEDRRFEHEEVLVLVLEYKLVNEWILFQTLQLLPQSFMFDLYGPVPEHLKLPISIHFVI